jgi:hypothetical protein
MPRSQLLRELGGTGLCLHLRYEALIGLDVGIDLGPMAVVVGQRRMHRRQRQAGIRRHDFLRRHPHPLVPNSHMLDLDPVPRNVRLAPAETRLDGDVFADDGQSRFGRRGWGSGCVDRHNWIIEDLAGGRKTHRGFSETAQPTHFVFEYTGSGSLLMFRCHCARDSVTPANLATVRKLLDERGLLPADEFDNRLHKAPA